MIAPFKYIVVYERPADKAMIEEEPVHESAKAMHAAQTYACMGYEVAVWVRLNEPEPSGP